jgi:carbonic anhydrase
MNRQFLGFKAFAFASVCVLSLAAQAAGNTPHWGYSGHGGPSHWAELDAAFETCAKGSAQSPINISKTEKTDLPALEFQYGDAVPTIVNNGHTVQVNLPAGNSLKVGDKRYELLQFHFHTPSEEQVNGKRTAMVAHFVHKNAEGALGVIGVLLQPGKKNEAFEPVFAHLPRPNESITVDHLKLDLAGMLPAAKGYYAFAGSLTTPPCSEGVSWMVLKTPVTLSQKQIKAFRQLFSFNARPVQPGYDRVIKESK